MVEFVRYVGRLSTSIGRTILHCYTVSDGTIVFYKTDYYMRPRPSDCDWIVPGTYVEDAS